MNYYVIQSKAHAWDTAWTTWTNRRFDTLAEARAAFAALPIKADHRIAEAYTVTRYKPVKADGQKETAPSVRSTESGKAKT